MVSAVKLSVHVVHLYFSKAWRLQASATKSAGIWADWTPCHVERTASQASPVTYVTSTLFAGSSAYSRAA
jgi:hypothetical protein